MTCDHIDFEDSQRGDIAQPSARSYWWADMVTSVMLVSLLAALVIGWPA